MLAFCVLGVLGSNIVKMALESVSVISLFFVWPTYCILQVLHVIQ